ncbi:MAG: transposase [Vicinamibacterales bacterium]
MARPARIEFAAAMHHVMARGVEKRIIFLDDRDRRTFLATLDETAARFDWRVWAYCLMANHYHLLVQTMRPTLSRGMRDLNGAYSQGFNRRHDRVGHLFQGRFKSLLVDGDRHLHQVARYIVLNPVRAGLCATPEQWRWSSYRAQAGLASGPNCLAANDALRHFDRDRRVARAAFRRFVIAGAGASDPAAGATRLGILGDDTFVRQVTGRARMPTTEVPRVQRRAGRLLAHFAHAHARRDDAITAAHASGLYTLAEIGRHFGLHYATISKIVSRTRPRLRSKT